MTKTHKLMDIKTKIILAFLFFMLFNQDLQSQDKVMNIGLVVNGGVTGMNTESSKVESSNYESLRYSSPSESFSTGMFVSWLFNENNKLYVSSELLFDYSKFRKTHEMTYIDLFGSTINSKSVNEFRLMSILIPVKVRKKINNFSLGLGFINTITYYGGIFNMTEGTNELVKTNREPYHKTDEIGNIYLEEWHNFQYVIEVLYEISKNLTLGIEYRKYLDENKLMHKVSYIDYSEYKEHVIKPNSIRLSLMFKIE